MKLGQLLVVVQSRDHRRVLRVGLLQRSVGAAHLLVADAGFGLEDLVVGLLFFQPQRRRRGLAAFALAVGRQEAPGDALDVLGHLGLGVFGHQRTAAARRQPDGLVRFDVAEVFEGMTEPPLRRRGHPDAQLQVRQRARLVDDELGAKAADLVLETLRGAAAVAVGAVQVDGRRGRAGLVDDQTFKAAGGAQLAHEGALDEAVGRLDGRRIGQGHDDGDVGRQPQVDGRGRIGHAQIGDDIVGLQLAQRDQRRLGRLFGLHRPEGGALAGDQADARHGGVDDQLGQAGGPSAQELTVAALRARRAQQLMQGAAGRVGVDDDHLLPGLRQVHRDVGRDERPAGSAAAGGERNQVGAAGSGSLNLGCAVGRAGARRFSSGGASVYSSSISRSGSSPLI